ncbi:uncharacterized protein LOC114525619 [Dendronephthya gigantea]|uniref:uncharacterized protein LOC114525619 n=1 Tax=Dendronephthya gigantea TaxID=151771 RepID=UPI00106953E8|nr:uncharacterized protein LOC114525619 [Dendronephthya gigantea]
MSLFDATVSQVVKDVSHDTLVPVRNRCAADYCKLMSLVERKTRCWHLPWKSKYKYIPAETTLNDILTKEVDVKSHFCTSVLFKDYASTPSFHKAGKIGGKIAEEFDVDVSINETMQVSLKLGDVIKREVVWQELYDCVNGKAAKGDHPLLKTIKSSTKKSLFLIGMVVTSGVITSLDKETKFGGDLGGTPHVQLTLNSDGSSDAKQHRQYTIPPGTTLAYCCYKLKVGNDGVLNLQLPDDLTDAPLPAKEKIFEVESIQQALSGLLTNEANDDLIILLRKILNCRPACAFKLNIVVENAIDILQGESVLCTITIPHLKKIFTEDCFPDCFKFLEIAGAQVDQENNKLVFPEDKLDLLISLNLLLDCLSEMGNFQIQILTECDISHRDGILSALQKAIESAGSPENAIDFSDSFTEEHAVARFLRSLGLDLVRKDSSLHVEYLPKCQSAMQLRSSVVAVLGMCSV